MKTVSAASAGLTGRRPGYSSALNYRWLNNRVAVIFDDNSGRTSSVPSQSRAGEGAFFVSVHREFDEPRFIDEHS